MLNRFDNVVKLERQAIALPERQTIAIIGGGFSGTMVAIHLLKSATQPLNIQLIERSPQLGKGVAYGTQQDCHLLNVPADKISAFADDPNHFCRWLQQYTDLIHSSAFVPRKFFGQYIQAVLDEAEANASLKVRFEHIIDEALSVKPDGNKLLILLDSGNVLSADRVVLALGNLPPKDPAVADPSFYQSPRYIRSAWSNDALSRLAPDASVLLVGSGLTAVDMMLTLRQQSHQGTIHLVSRRGLLPQAHRSSPGKKRQSDDFNSTSLVIRALLRQVRQQVDRAVAEGEDWRSVIDALRPHTQTLWQKLPLAEKQRFLRHVRPYWEVHRHRLAPAIAQYFTTLIHAGVVCIHAARIHSYYEDASGVNVIIRNRGSYAPKTLRVQAVVNCTGPECNYRTSTHPLIANLLAAKLIRPDALDLGLDVASNGALIAADGIPSSQLHTIGSSRKGQLWETTAVPEIREQAKVLAEQLLAESVVLR